VDETDKDRPRHKKYVLKIGITTHSVDKVSPISDKTTY
jgi:hypothetical protein